MNSFDLSTIFNKDSDIILKIFLIPCKVLPICRTTSCLFLIELIHNDDDENQKLNKQPLIKDKVFYPEFIISDPENGLLFVLLK